MATEAPKVPTPPAAAPSTPATAPPATTAPIPATPAPTTPTPPAAAPSTPAPAPPTTPQKSSNTDTSIPATQIPKTTTPPTPLTSTIVQATEHIIIEGATAVVTQVVKSTTSDLKNVENNLAKEVVSATDEDVPSLLDKVEDGLQDVAKEVVKGAEAAVEAVEQHPELIAEGALAVAIGAASLIQPELVAGEVALIGKMAADSAKKTVSTIASDTGSKVVKAISADLANDAKAEAAKDAAAAAEKEKTEGKAEEVAAKNASDPKAAPVEPAKDVPNGTLSNPADAGIPSTTDAVSKDAKPTLTEPVKEIANGSAAKPTDSKIEPVKADSSGDRTIAIEVAQEPSKTPSSTDGGSSDSKKEPATVAPVSLKITLGADGEVKAVTKGDTADPAPESPQETSKTSSVETTTKTAVVSTQVKPQVVDPLSNTDQVAPKTSTVETTTKAPVVSPEAVKDNPEVVQDNSASRPKSPIHSDEANNLKSQNILKQDTSKLDVSKSEESNHSNPVNDSRTLDTQPPTISEKKPEETQNAPKASTPDVSSLAIVSAIATIRNTTKTETISKATPEGPIVMAEGKTVTVSQESLDLLHKKLDAMHEAIQQITKVLAFHMPTPPTGPANLVKNAEDEIQEALASAVKPLTDLLPEILHNDDSTHPPLEDPSTPKSSPKRPVPEKRTSVLGAIGKVFWPFGSTEKITTVTVTEVAADRTETAA